MESNTYYPFGLLHNYSVTTQNAYQYKYNGKELQETGMYDYGARFYMPDIGRWGVVDPLAETSRRWSTYNYAYDNPIMFVDPDGREAERCCKYLKDAWSGFKQESKNIVLGGLQLAVRPGKTIGTVIGGAVNDIKAGRYSSAADKITNLTHMGTTDMVKNAFSAIKGDGKAAGALGAQGLTIALAEGAGRIGNAARVSKASEKIVAAEIEAGSASSKTIIVTQESVTQALQDSNLQTAQGVVSGPMVERYVEKIQLGETAPPIKVTLDGVIVDGNHRYVAGKLTGNEPAQVPGTLSPSQQSKVQPVQNTKVDQNDWGGN